MSETWFRIALADAGGTRLVVAPGERLGDAVDLARRRAARGRDAWPIAVELAAPGDVPLGESVGKGVVVARDAPADLPAFRWPSGVVPTLDGARELGAPAEGRRRSRHGDTIAIEAVIAGDRLVETFMEVVEQLPTADNVEVRIAGHHDDAGTTEVWLTPRLGDPRRAIRFLDDHEVELLGNGHVEISVYLRKHRSTLRMTQHKTIVWLTEAPQLAAQFCGWMDARQIPPRDALTMIASVGHFHWRPVATRGRARLIHHLERARLRRVDSWRDAAEEAP
jgi:hypothetical protein